jgi:outer membrane immunogenic protein
MTRKLAHAGVAALALLAVPFAANAADLPIKAPHYVPPPAPAWGWNGFYAGINGGWGWGDDPAAFSAATTPAQTYFNGGAVPAGVNAHPSGGVFGVQLGYNWQWTPSIVFGIETDFDYAQISGAGSVATTAGGFVPFTTAADQSLNWLGTLRGRIGYAFDRALVYGTGGLAYGHTTLTTAVIGPAGTLCAPTGLCAATAGSAWQTGWAAGAGIEWAFTPALTFKAEYLHYDLGSRSLLQSDPAAPTIVFGSSVSFSGDIVRAGLNFKFDMGGGPVVARY